MRTLPSRLPALVAAALTALAAAAPTLAQDPAAMPPVLRPFAAPIGAPFPWLTWVSFTGTNQGLGYDGSYFTLGAKGHLGEDMLGGMWMMETRGHVATERGNFFGNFGVERQYYLAPAYSHLGVAAFYDLDADQAAVFGHTFHQVGVTGYIKNELFDIHVNGYIPVGTTDYVENIQCFQGNRIIVPGQDSALAGIDSDIRLYLPRWSMFEGTFDIGGYYYRGERDDLVAPFGGVLVRLGVQTQSGAAVNLQLTHDERFSTSFYAQASLRFGAAQSYAENGRDLEPTIRNDHIVRFGRGTFVAINPATGAPYNVVHVNNTAAAGTGTFEDPFASLALAQAGSAPNDIIFVNVGDGTDTNMNAGITLQAGQRFFGNGAFHDIPIVGGNGVFRLCNDPALGTPNISNTLAPVVTLASNTEVAGFNISGLGAGGTGIAGVGVSNVLIRNNSIGSALDNGIFITGGAGTFTVRENVIGGVALPVPAGAGIVFDNTPAQVLVQRNTITAGGSGVIMQNTVGGNFTVEANTVTAGGIGHAVEVNGGSGGVYAIRGLPIVGPQTLTGGAAGDGVHIEGHTAGAFTIADNTITGSGNSGVHVLGSSTSEGAPTPNRLAITGNTIIGNGNAAGEAGVRIDLSEGGAITAISRIDAIIQGNTIGGTAANANEAGIIALATGSPIAVGGPTLVTTITGNGITDNRRNGVQLASFNGASHFATVGGGAAADVNQINNNGSGGAGTQGAGIQLLTGGGNLAAGASLLSVSIVNNDVFNNNGLVGENVSGILGTIADATDLTATISGNRVNNAGVLTNDGRDSGIGFNFGATFDTLTPGTRSLVTLTGNTVASHQDHGFLANVNGLATGRVQFDVVQNSSTLSAEDGMFFNTFGAGGVVAQLNLTTNNNFSNNQDQGLHLAASGATRLIANVLNNNNATVNAGFNNNTDEGILATAIDTSALVLTATNNTAISNGAEGMDLQLGLGGGATTANLFAFVDRNTLRTNAGAAPDFQALVDTAASTPGQLCLVLTRNIATNTVGQIDYQFTNNSAVGTPSQLNLELDAANPNVGVLSIPPVPVNINLVPVGTCATAVLGPPDLTLFP